jgi:sulfate/thiosulfate-binding protein
MLRAWWTNLGAVAAILAAAGAVVAKSKDSAPSAHELRNVSYDATRELYRAIDAGFAADYARRTGERVIVSQSHGGSTRQSRAVASGLEADVVTFALPSDVEFLRRRGLVAEGWAERLPNHSHPYVSTVVFVVRRGNPFRVADWPDLVRPGLAVVAPDPKTSGNGKLAFLAAWGSVLARGGDEEAARAFVTALYTHAAALEAGARGARIEFADEGVGDVHLAWESEALLEVAESAGDLAIVYPPRSIRAEPSVALVDANVARRGTRAEAQAYLEYLFTPEAQETIARQGYRPFRDDVLARHGDTLPAIELFPVTAVAKDWDDAVSRFFSDGGVFDGLNLPRAR